METLYSVINMDLVASRNIKARPLLQKKLHNYIEKVNMECKDILLAPITITLGDEWQIVLKKPGKSYYMVEKFQKFLAEEKIAIYAGIGIGTISTEIYKDTRLMDGECFIKAREALNISKDENRFYSKRLNSKKNRIYFNGEEIDFLNNIETLPTFKEVAVTYEKDEDYFLSINSIVNTIIENNEVLKSKITDKQLEIIKLYEKYGSYNNIIKEKEHLTKASISQKLNDSSYFVIKNNNFMIELLIELYCNIREGN